MAAQVLYPVDDWTEATLPDGRRWEVREAVLVVGYTGGRTMERDVAFIRFSGLPGELSRATLVLHAVEYLNPIYPALVKAAGQTLFSDDRSQPGPIEVEVTGLVRASAGELVVSIEPQPPAEADNFIRFYGSRRGEEKNRPRLLLEGAPLVNPPPGQTPPVELVTPPTSQVLGGVMPLLVLGVLAGLSRELGEAVGGLG